MKKPPFLIDTVVVTISDKGSRKERIDQSGPTLVSYLHNFESGQVYRVTDTFIIPDERPQISTLLSQLADERKVHLVLTTGGTGFTPRDVTPEATTAILDKLAPGLPEAMRAFGMKITPYAMLSRAVAGLRKETLIINLPGSPKAAVENLSAIIGVIPHTFEMGDHAP